MEMRTQEAAHRLVGEDVVLGHSRVKAGPAPGVNSGYWGGWGLGFQGSGRAAWADTRYSGALAAGIWQ